MSDLFIAGGKCFNKWYEPTDADELQLEKFPLPRSAQSYLEYADIANDWRKECHEKLKGAVPPLPVVVDVRRPNIKSLEEKQIKPGVIFERDEIVLSGREFSSQEHFLSTDVRNRKVLMSKEISDGEIWQARLCPVFPRPELFDNEEAFRRAALNWMEVAGKTVEKIPVPRELLQSLPSVEKTEPMKPIFKYKEAEKRDLKCCYWSDGLETPSLKNVDFRKLLEPRDIHPFEYPENELTKHGVRGRITHKLKATMCPQSDTEFTLVQYCQLIEQGVKAIPTELYGAINRMTEECYRNQTPMFIERIYSDIRYLRTATELLQHHPIAPTVRLLRVVEDLHEYPHEVATLYRILVTLHFTRVIDILLGNVNSELQMKGTEELDKFVAESKQRIREWMWTYPSGNAGIMVLRIIQLCLNVCVSSTDDLMESMGLTFDFFVNLWEASPDRIAQFQLIVLLDGNMMRYMYSFLSNVDRIPKAFGDASANFTATVLSINPFMVKDSQFGVTNWARVLILSLLQRMTTSGCYSNAKCLHDSIKFVQRCIERRRQEIASWGSDCEAFVATLNTLTPYEKDNKTLLMEIATFALLVKEKPCKHFFIAFPVPVRMFYPFLEHSDMLIACMAWKVIRRLFVYHYTTITDIFRSDELHLNIRKHLKSITEYCSFEIFKMLLQIIVRYIPECDGNSVKDSPLPHQFVAIWNFVESGDFPIITRMKPFLKNKTTSYPGGRTIVIQLKREIENRLQIVKMLGRAKGSNVVQTGMMMINVPTWTYS